MFVSFYEMIPKGPSIYIYILEGKFMVHGCLSLLGIKSFWPDTVKKMDMENTWPFGGQNYSLSSSWCSLSSQRADESSLFTGEFWLFLLVVSNTLRLNATNQHISTSARLEGVSSVAMCFHVTSHVGCP